VTPAIPSIPLGTTQQFSATGTFTDHSTQDITKTVQWGSSSAAVATISNASGTQGLASSVGTGVSTISASSGSVIGSTPLTVNPAMLASIAVSAAANSTPAGTTDQFTATGTFSDGTTKDLTSSVTWTSSNPSLATINASGLAKGLMNGTSTISASTGSSSGSATLTVTPAALVSIAVSAAASSIPLGTTDPFTATGTFTDGTMQDITTSVFWTSSSATVATVSDSSPTIGLAT